MAEASKLPIDPTDAINVIDNTGKSIFSWFDKPHQNARDFLSKKIIEDDSLSTKEKTALLWDIRRLTREYKNTSNIYNRSKEKFSVNNQAKTVNEDWLSLFFDRAKHISDEGFQDMWAKVLAGECNNNGSVPLAIIHVLSLLDPLLATAFTNYCSVSFEFSNSPQAFICNPIPKFYIDLGITNDFLMTMDALGILQYTPGMVGDYAKFPLVVRYKNDLVRFSKTENNDKEIVSIASYTQIGKKLYELINALPSKDFFDFAIQFYAKDGIKLEIIK